MVYRYRKVILTIMKYFSMRNLIRISAVLMALLVTVFFSGTAMAGWSNSSTQYPVGNIFTAASAFFSPNTPPPGANVPGCKLTSSHPYPVILVNATFANEDDNWVYLSPTIANAGYCVYTFNYGVTISQNITALGDIATSAGELATEVNNVLTATGAKKVDLVGHSQGGMMPNYYIKFLGGASKVATFIGLAPSNHGTTLDGLTNLGNALDLLVGANSLFSDLSMPALAEQEAGSQFETNLFASGDTVPGPRYVVIETKYDEVVTPYTNAFLKGATNILIQNQCPFDFVGHIGMAFDGVVAQDVLNQLGNPNPWFQPSCWSTGPWF